MKTIQDGFCIVEPYTNHLNQTTWRGGPSRKLQSGKMLHKFPKSRASLSVLLLGKRHLLPLKASGSHPDCQSQCSQQAEQADALSRPAWPVWRTPKPNVV